MEHLNQLTPGQQQRVLSLIQSATQHDQVPPISDHILLHLRHGGDKQDSHLVIYEDNNPNHQIVGYAHLDQTDLVAGPSVELVVDPKLRQGDIGNQLLQAAIKICGKRLRLWSHGDLITTNKLALYNNFQKIRTVLQLHMGLSQIYEVKWPDSDLTIRSFLPQLDSTAWLSLNNKVFANHPEQGNWSLDDLNLRLKEDWFDEKGLFIVEKGNQIIASSWTKIHGASTHDHGDAHIHDHSAIGEVYVTAVDPQYAGGGIGRALTLTALNYLKYQGLNDVILYVDEENTAALNLYKSIGFVQSGKDILFKLKS